MESWSISNLFIFNFSKFEMIWMLQKLPKQLQELLRIWLNLRADWLLSCQAALGNTAPAKYGIPSMPR